MKIRDLARKSRSILDNSRVVRGVAAISTLSLLGLTQSAAANDSLATSQSASAGIAIYASYLDADLAAEEGQRLEATLQQPVQLSEAQVDGTLYLRLQSEPLDPAQARALVSQAQAAGYSAWFASAGTATATAIVYDTTSRTSAYSGADLSHLNLAVTEPLPGAGQQFGKPTTIVTTQPHTPALPEQNFQSAGSLRKGASPELEEQLAEGPLLGEIYPPRAPLPRQ